MPSGLLTDRAKKRYADGMDGLTSLLLYTLPNQEVMVSLTDLGILATAMLLAVLSALALVRQVFFAITVRD